MFPTILLLYRVFDISLITFSLLEGVFFQDIRGIILAILTGLSILVNGAFKQVAKTVLGKGSIGNRPKGAENCGYLPTGKSKSYGMPSGHSQTFAFIATMLAIGLKRDSYYLLKLVGIILLVLGAMYARVHAGCHTILQTIVGVTIGISMAIIVTKYYRNPFLADEHIH